MAAHSLQDKVLALIIQPLSLSNLYLLSVTFPWAGLREASKSTALIPIYAFTFTSPSVQNVLDPSPKFSIPSHGTLHQACFYAQ